MYINLIFLGEGIIKLLPFDLISSCSTRFATETFYALLNLATLSYQNVRQQLAELLIKCVNYIQFNTLTEKICEDKKVLNNGEIYTPLTRDMGEWIKDPTNPSVIMSYDSGITNLDQVLRCIFRIRVYSRYI